MKKKKFDCEYFKMKFQFVGSILSLLGSYSHQYISTDDFVKRLLVLLDRYYFSYINKKIVIGEDIKND